MTGKADSTGTRIAVILVAIAAAAGCTTTDANPTRIESNDDDMHQDATYLARAEAQDKETLICRRERPTGSRISEKVCLTAEDWDKIEQQSQEMLNRATRRAQQYEDQ